MGMAKIAFISHSYVESSSRTKLTYLAKATDLRLITPSAYPTPYGLHALDSEFNTGVTIQSYPIQFLYLKRTPTRWLLRSRDLGFRQFQPDIIHVEMEPHGWITCQALMYRRLFAPKAKVIIFSWENLTLQEQGIKARTLEYLSRFNRRFMDFFICGNIAGKQILVSKGIAADKIAVLPQCGVDPEVFWPYSPEQREACRRELGISQNEFAIGFVGRFVVEKGILDLVKAVGRLKACSQRGLVLILAGKGPLEASVRLRAGELGIRLVILPSRKYHEVAATMNSLDTLVLPSRSTSFWKEQFGRVLIEAMACGVPVIGSDSGDISNVIGDAGLVFPEGDAGQLSECLRLCCDNEPFRLELSRRGLDRVLKNFTNREIARRTLEIYDKFTKYNDAEAARSEVVEEVRLGTDGINRTDTC
jgi:L-malate glycosyltransferase